MNSYDILVLDEAKVFVKAKDGSVTVIVASHGFEKEGSKTPQQQIERAERIKKEFQSANK